MIEYRNIHKAFDLPVLSGVDMRVETGEMFALFGPSGTGKSVLLKTTIGLVVPDVGDVEVDGISVYRGGRGAVETVRKKVGYVFQNSALFDSLNVFDNVAMGVPEDVLARMSRKESAAKVWEALELVNLEPREILSKIPSELSGGMKKRVGIARATIARPRLVIYDEPTAGLDPVTTSKIYDLVAADHAETGCTVVAVSSDVDALAEFTDTIAMIYDGQVRYHGPVSDIYDADDPVVRQFVRGELEGPL